LVRSWWTRTRLLALAATVQVGCGSLMIIDLISEMSDYRDDLGHALLDLTILAALILGSALILGELRRLRAANAQMAGRLRAASGAFVELIEETFATWGLTPAEREVAYLSVKGFSIEEIAALRDARSGTVRAQCAAVYRKAGVSGRAQLLSHFMDDLLAGADLTPRRG
jgi:DNA-binding CsgD family transcriptional regulator